jgi:hypothetical protein
MATFINTQKAAFNQAEQFKESFTETSGVIGYITIGNSVAYANESSPSSIVDTIQEERNVWNNAFAAKRVTGNDVELVLPRYNWVTGQKYRQFDDTILVDDLVSSNSSQSLGPMYVITSSRNVYKCLSNNASANSTVEPTGDYSSSNGVISTGDGYRWKYLYNIKPSNKFLTSVWMPAPTSREQVDYTTSNTGIVAGELTTVVVTTRGSGYDHPTVTVSAFAINANTLTLANTTNVAANMTVSGTGIASNTHITAIDVPNNNISLSKTTTASGGASGNNLTLSTRVYFDGDGSVTPLASVSLLANGAVEKITLTAIGSGYSRANVVLYGSGTNANTRCILAPKFGHANNPAKELIATNVMLATKIGEIDSTENGLISIDTSIRQLGLIINPYKYGESAVVSSANANSVISQTTDVTLVSGSSYTLDEFVYQGSASNPSASGHVHAQSATSIRITRVQGSFSVGLPIIGETSGVSRIAVSKDDPEFEPYSGDVLYAENVTKIDREDGQAENIKFVIQF